MDTCKKASLRLMMIATCALSCMAITLGGTLATLAMAAPAGALSQNWNA